MSRLIDADICLITAWQNFYKQEDEHKKNIDGYDIMRDQFYEQSGFECCQQTIVNAPTVKAIPIEVIEQIRKEIETEMEFSHDGETYISTDMVLNIIDKAIKEENE